MLLRILFRLLTDWSRETCDWDEPRRPAPAAEQGFTLVELMVVIVIIGLLATVVVVNVMPSRDQAMATKAQADIATLEQAMEMYRLDNLTYPAGSDGLNALVSPPPTLSQPGRYRPGGYIKNLPKDPWGRPYELTVPGRSGPFDIYSLGGDGAPGGEGENADIHGGQG
ncbi:MAG: type II secretion system major pseudopilin GspG [Sphingomonas sp.]|nr:type II secretion system major pseudopilin GspG [Sphingomonas sp.]